MIDNLKPEEWDALRSACSQIVNAPMLTLQRLAEAETTIGKLKHMIGEQADEIAELHADLEWAAENSVEFFSNGRRSFFQGRSFADTAGWYSHNYREAHDWDGTPEDLRRVIRAARKGE